MASSDLTWLLVKKWNAFQVKGVPEGPVFSKEPVSRISIDKLLWAPADSDSNAPHTGQPPQLAHPQVLWVDQLQGTNPTFNNMITLHYRG